MIIIIIIIQNPRILHVYTYLLDFPFDDEKMKLYDVGFQEVGIE